MQTVTDTSKRNGSSRYGWYIIALGALTHLVVSAMARTCMPVLFPEILKSLGLDLVQIGLVWGLLPLGGIIMALPGGLLGDRFGIKRILVIASVLCGITGALRGVSGNFVLLAITTFAFGVVVSVIPINVHKLASIWVPRERVGLANGILSVGMALGFVIGTLISARWLSPALGGWQYVFYMYGAMSVVIGLWWLFTRAASRTTSVVPFRESFSKVARIRKVWLLGLVLLAQAGCVEALLGYLPTYLEEYRGWPAGSGGDPVFAFHLISTVFTVPMAFLSDRIGSRKKVLLPALALTATGTALLAIPNDISIWPLMLIAGITRDGFMAVFITFTTETKGIGLKYAATAIGSIFMLERIGLFMAPAVGNYLGQHIDLELPFLFWGALAAMGFVILFFLKESKKAALSESV